MRLITQQQVARLLPMKACIDLMAETLLQVHRGEAVMPLRTITPLPGGGGALGAMPSWLAGVGLLGVKVITVFPGNAGTPLDSHIGAVLLFSETDGQLEAMLDASSITGIRTAAVSGLATRELAREDASVLGMLGSGVQARTHLEAVAAVRPIREVKVWSPTEARRDAFGAWAREWVPAWESDGEHTPLEVTVCDRAEEAVRETDVLCVATASPTPVVEAEWIAPGCHINAVGAHTPTTREIDSTTVAAAAIYVDSMESAMNEAGDLLIPIHEGRLAEEDIRGEIGALLDGEIEGRGSGTEVTLFKSLGLAVEDLASAAYVYRRAVEEEIGTDFALGGMREG